MFNVLVIFLWLTIIISVSIGFYIKNYSGEDKFDKDLNESDNMDLLNFLGETSYSWKLGF